MQTSKEALVPVWSHYDMSIRVVRGMAGQLVSHLVDKSSQPLNMDRNPQDHLDRFASHPNFRTWYQRLRQPQLYWVIRRSEDQPQDLAGFLWAESMPPGSDSPAVCRIAKPRVYEPHEYLRGLAQNIILECARDYKTLIGRPQDGYAIIPDDMELWQPRPVGPEPAITP